jgi:hypothetical protein
VRGGVVAGRLAEHEVDLLGVDVRAADLGLAELAPAEARSVAPEIARSV